ncbi:hypothetical protein D3C85_1638040 [compost metagenome]
MALCLTRLFEYFQVYRNTYFFLPVFVLTWSKIAADFGLLLLIVNRQLRGRYVRYRRRTGVWLQTINVLLLLLLRDLYPGLFPSSPETVAFLRVLWRLVELQNVLFLYP